MLKEAGQLFGHDSPNHSILDLLIGVRQDVSKTNDCGPIPDHTQILRALTTDADERLANDLEFALNCRRKHFIRTEIFVTPTGSADGVSP